MIFAKPDPSEFFTTHQKAIQAAAKKLPALAELDAHKRFIIDYALIKISSRMKLSMRGNEFNSQHVSAAMADAVNAVEKALPLCSKEDATEFVSTYTTKMRKAIERGERKLQREAESERAR